MRCTIASIGPSLCVHEDVPASLHPGSHAQFISGFAAITGVNETSAKNNIVVSFFIYL